MVRQTVVAMLGPLGYDLLEAANGLKPKVLLASAKEVSVALVDVEMPNQTGPECIRTHSKDPSLAFILTMDLVEIKFQMISKTTAWWVFSKPFRLEELHTLVKRDTAYPY